VYTVGGIEMDSLPCLLDLVTLNVTYYFHGIYRVRILACFYNGRSLRSIPGVVVSTEACGL